MNITKDGLKNQLINKVNYIRMKKITMLIVFIFCVNLKAQVVDNSLEICSNKFQSNYLFAPHFSFIENTLLYLFLCENEIKNEYQEDDFLGYWSVENQVIEIYKMENSYYGKIISNDTNKNNNDRNVLIQMKKKKNKVLYGGTYYDAKINKRYEAKIKLIDKNTIRFKGFYGLFNKKYIWKRLE
jgi:uncharacterized protein (DUF2147 family)